MSMNDDDFARELWRYNGERNAAVQAGMTFDEFDALHASLAGVADDGVPGEAAA